MSRPQVIVRMYLNVVGDCFLIRTRPDNADEQAPWSHIMIDCGISPRSDDSQDLCRRIAEDICADTGGSLDLLVVTHNHWDHVGGFAEAKNVFLADTGIKIDNLWLAWTQKGGDRQARKLQEMFDKLRAAIAVGVERERKLAPTGAGESKLGMGLERFEGPLDDQLAPDGPHWTAARIIERLKERAANLEYLEPGQIIDAPGAPYLRAFVLGPPRSEALLLRELPSKGAAGKRGLHAQLAAREDEADSVARNLNVGRHQADFDDSPFSQRHQSHRDLEFLNMSNPGAKAPPRALNLWSVRQLYLQGGDDWRRIDKDWIGVATQLALKFDSDTNNTSLVLAFEVEAGGDVLLFAADAQVSNWLSWHDRSYSPGNNQEPVTAAGLLRRTVLYKVAQLGGRGAELGAKGPELMIHPDLVAMIPMADPPPSAGQAPSPSQLVLDRLAELTQGRILRGDARLPSQVPEEQRRFADRVRYGPEDGRRSAAGNPPAPLWVEYQLS